MAGLTGTPRTEDRHKWHSLGAARHDVLETLMQGGRYESGPRPPIEWLPRQSCNPYADKLVAQTVRELDEILQAGLSLRSVVPALGLAQGSTWFNVYMALMRRRREWLLRVGRL